MSIVKTRARSFNAACVSLNETLNELIKLTNAIVSEDETGTDENELFETLDDALEELAVERNAYLAHNQFEEFYDLNLQWKPRKA